jgi:hypothetical protein
LRTSETEIALSEPRAPDIRVGRVFDRNYELLSPILPVWAVRAAVRQHFARTIPRAIEQNLSRLSSQWEAAIHAALRDLEKESCRRLDELMSTVQKIVQAPEEARVPQLRADLERVRRAREELAALQAAPARDWV